MQRFRLFPKNTTSIALIWLVFLTIPIIYLFPFDTLQKRLAGFLILVFAWCYRNTLFQGKYFMCWFILQYLIASFYAFAFGYIYLFMFPAWQLGFSKLRNKSFWLLYIILLLIMSIGLFGGLLKNPPFNGDQKGMILVFGLFIIFAPFASRQIRRQLEERKQLYQANQRLEMVIKGEERNRIARELHDSLGQSLSLMTIKLDLTQKMFKKQPQLVANELKELEQLSRSTLKTVREIVSDMRKRKVSEELIEINHALTTAQIILLTENEGLADSLTSFQQFEMSNILKETVTNIIRHSQASHCTISFSKTASQLKVVVQDNGIGGKNFSAGNGIIGMQERVTRMAGTLMIQTENGTSVIISIPLKEASYD